MKTNILIGAIIFLALALLWQIKCNTSKPQQIEITHIKPDKRITDSLESVIRILRTTTALVKTDFEKTGKTVIKTKIEYREARAVHDTVRSFEKCDEMSLQLDTAEAKYAVLRFKTDSLANATTIQHIQDTTSLGRCLLDYDRLDARTNLLLNEKKKADRRFTIGPFAGVSYVGGKFIPVGGIGIVYRIFRL